MILTGQGWKRELGEEALICSYCQYSRIKNTVSSYYEHNLVINDLVHAEYLPRLDHCSQTVLCTAKPLYICMRKGNAAMTVTMMMSLDAHKGNIQAMHSAGDLEND